MYIAGCCKTLTVSQYKPSIKWFLENPPSYRQSNTKKYKRIVNFYGIILKIFLRRCIKKNKGMHYSGATIFFCLYFTQIALRFLSFQIEDLETSITPFFFFFSFPKLEKLNISTIYEAIILIFSVNFPMVLKSNHQENLKNIIKVKFYRECCNRNLI